MTAEDAGGQGTPSAISRARLVLLVVVLTVLWGTNWGLFAIAVREVSVWTFRAVCLLASGAVLLAVARLRGISLHVPAGERASLAKASLSYLVVWHIATTYAAVLLPSGQAALLGFTMPVWLTLIAWIVFHERPSSRMLGGVFLAACGITLLLVSSRGNYSSSSLAGFAFGLAAAIGWAMGTLILKRARISVQPIVSTGWQLVIAGAPVAAIAAGLGTWHPFVPSWTTVVVIGYIALVPMAFGNVVWFSIVRLLPVSVSSLSAVMVPVVAMITGALFLGEPLGLVELLAMVLCAGALLLTLTQHKMLTS